MIQPFQYVEVAVVARNNLLSTFISVQTDNRGFKYNQGNQWSSSSGSHCSCYLFSKKPLSFWGVGSFKVPVMVCLLAATPWAEKIRILSLPRDWAAGGRIYFFHLVLSRQRADWRRRSIPVSAPGMDRTWFHLPGSGCEDTTLPSETAVACTHHPCERRMMCLNGICPVHGFKPQLYWLILAITLS